MKTAIWTKTAALAGAWILATVLTANAKTISVSPPTASKGTYGSYVRMTWPANAYARKGYNVYRTTTPVFRSAVRLGTTKSRVWVDRKAGAAREYWYWVEPVGYKLIAGQRALSRQGGYRHFAVPTPKISRSTAGVTIKWNPSAQAKKGYRIYRGTSPSFALASALANTTARSYVDRSAYPGRTYYYWIAVRGYNVTVHNASKRRAGFRNLVVPTPSGKWTGTAYSDPFYISWSSVYGATKYQIYRGTSSANATLLYTTTGTGLYDYSVPHDGTWYSYWVCPIDIENRPWCDTSKCVRARNN